MWNVTELGWSRNDEIFDKFLTRGVRAGLPTSRNKLRNTAPGLRPPSGLSPQSIKYYPIDFQQKEDGPRGRAVERIAANIIRITATRRVVYARQPYAVRYI
jgi:hypothetical protein